MLHVTNGDEAAGGIRAAASDGDVLPWRDVLHEGPVPAGLSVEDLRETRAGFIAAQGWGELDEVRDEFARRDATLAGFRDHEEVVLWFEHDLYDQLQLVQLLDWFAGRDPGSTRLTLVCRDEYLGSLPSGRLRELLRQRCPVTPAELALGRRAWEAFRSPDPTSIPALLRGDTSALPFLEGALVRHLEQFPSLANGLSRSEAQALEAISSGRSVLRDAFLAAHHEREERPFLGDAVFASYLEGLSRGEALVVFEDGSPISAPRGGVDRDGFWRRGARVTEAGRAVLGSRRDWVAINGIDRWLGGVHLHGNDAAWRWDAAARRLEPRGAGAGLPG